MEVKQLSSFELLALVTQSVEGLVSDPDRLVELVSALKAARMGEQQARASHKQVEPITTIAGARAKLETT